MFKKINILIGLLSSTVLIGSDNHDKLHMILVSHFRWMKNPIHIPKGVINFDKDNKSYYGANTPTSFSRYGYEYENYDLGQDKSVRHLNQQYQQDPKAADKKCVMFGLHDSAATITNWLAQKKPAEQKKIASGLVIMDGLGNGNHAIMHTIGVRQYIAPLSFLPFSRLWLPCLAKSTVLPSYNPLGVQALDSAKKLDPSLPVIIIHNRRHSDFPINDARQYYLNLRACGNQQAYLMEFDESTDIDMKGLQAVYKKHNLPYDLSIGTDASQAELRKFQPEVAEVRKRISSSAGGYSTLARNVIDVACGAAIIASVYCKYSKKD